MHIKLHFTCYTRICVQIKTLTWSFVFCLSTGISAECPYGQSEFDPRVRPWYVAASSGPKDIILVLDSSGSMEVAGRMSIMKEAANRVINTLGVSDYFSVVEFDSVARTVRNFGDGNIIKRATDEKAASQVQSIISNPLEERIFILDLTWPSRPSETLKTLKAQVDATKLFSS